MWRARRLDVECRLQDVKYGSNGRRVTLRREEWGRISEGNRLEGEGSLRNKGNFGRGDLDEEGS